MKQRKQELSTTSEVQTRLYYIELNSCDTIHLMRFTNRRMIWPGW